IVIAGRREEDLGLVLEPPERLAVNDPIAVALKRRPDVVFFLGAKAAFRVGALRRLRREDLPLARFELLAKRRHAAISFRKLVPRGTSASWRSTTFMPSSSLAVCTARVMPRPANRSSIFPIATTGNPFAFTRSSSVSPDGGSA